MNCCDEYGDCRRGRDCPARNRKIDQCPDCGGYLYADSVHDCPKAGFARSERIASTLAATVLWLLVSLVCIAAAWNRLG